MDPDALAEQTSRYFSAIGEELLTSGATIDKYIGDSVMAFWNAPEPQPDHVARGCRAALNAAHRVAALNAAFQAEGLRPMPTRFGLHTGEAVVGNIGSVDRMNYTAVGHVVNVASRIEGLNKRFGTTILVSEAVRLAAGGSFAFREIGEAVPAGATEPLLLHELVGEIGVADA
jgi:adenylate cyclase